MKRPPLLLQITRGIIRDPRTRRSAMFFLLLAALVQLFAGAVFLDGYLCARPLLFLLYWGFCAWITLAAALLALYDMLLIRAAARRASRLLRRGLLDETGETPADPAPPAPGDQPPPPSAGGVAPPK